MVQCLEVAANRLGGWVLKRKKKIFAALGGEAKNYPLFKWFWLKNCLKKGKIKGKEEKMYSYIEWWIFQKYSYIEWFYYIKFWSVAKLFLYQTLFLYRTYLYQKSTVQWISVKRDSDKGDFRLIGIQIGKPFTK